MWGSRPGRGRLLSVLRDHARLVGLPWGPVFRPPAPGVYSAAVSVGQAVRGLPRPFPLRTVTPVSLPFQASLRDPRLPSEATRTSDMEALSYLRWAALMILASSAVGLLVFLLPNSNFAPNDHTTLSATFHFGAAFYALLLVSGALAVVNILLLRGAFHRLAPIDARFSTPSKLVWVLLAGAALAGVGLIVVLVTLQHLGNCTLNATGGFTGNCQGLATLALGELILLPGSILVIIGYIGCLIGLWRAGERYQESSFKIGTVLLLIPLLSVAGAVLLFIAAHTTRAKLGGPGDRHALIPLRAAYRGPPHPLMPTTSAVCVRAWAYAA